MSSATKNAAVKLLGVPLSQPFTSCAWTLLQLGVPFDIQVAVPGAASRVGTKHENFTSRTLIGTTKIPLLVDTVDGEELTLMESPAILMYLCERYGKERSSTHHPFLYGAPGSKQKAMIDAYLHWHHGNTRSVSKLFGSKVRPDLKGLMPTEEEEIDGVLKAVDSGWLSSSPYIGGLDEPSIADILAYGEISTVTMTNLLSVENFSNISAWMNRMSLLPFHQESVLALSKLGDLSDDSNATPLAKRLGVATKAAMESYALVNKAMMGATESSKL